MYPIDLLKVYNLFQPSYSHPNHSAVDTDASRQPVIHRDLLWHIKCYGHNITSRRFSHTMEGGIQCSSRSRWVFDFSGFAKISI
jgi:hypothetical protein